MTMELRGLRADEWHLNTLITGSALNFRASYHVTRRVVPDSCMASDNEANEPVISISVIIFDVGFDPLDSGLTAEMALLEVFAYTRAAQLREDTKNIYQSGDYDQSPQGIWTGRFQKQRKSTQSNVLHDPERGYRFLDTGREITTEESYTHYAYNPETQVIAYRERAGMPYTRLRSYVRRACGASDNKYSIWIEPRREPRRLVDWLKHFSTVRSITADYRHSQSPGNRAVDMILERYRAQRIRETYRAKPNEELNKASLLDPDLPLAKAIDHVEKNKDNGEFIIDGKVGPDRILVRTSDEVERHKIPTINEPTEIRGTLEEVIRTDTDQGTQERQP